MWTGRSKKVEWTEHRIKNNPMQCERIKIKTRVTLFQWGLSVFKSPKLEFLKPEKFLVFSQRFSTAKEVLHFGTWSKGQDIELKFITQEHRNKGREYKETNNETEKGKPREPHNMVCKREMKYGKWLGNLVKMNQQTQCRLD